MERKKKVLIIIIIILIPLAALFLYFTPNPLKKGISGGILVNTTWGPGEIYISGDVVVMPWVTLTIEPGTTIKVAADSTDFTIDQADDNPDDWNTGDPTVDANAGGTDYVKTHNSIIVLGKIVCKGTAEKPIRIISDAEEPTYTDWVGISVHDGEFAYTEIAYCLYGAYSDAEYERLTFDYCYIHDNFATGVGFMNPANSQTTPAWVKHTTISDCGHEAIDTHSSGQIEIAYCQISKSQVGLNLRDDFLDVEDHILHANIHHNTIVDCNVPILIAGTSQIMVTHVVLQAQQQDATRWEYEGWTMVQMENPCAVFLEPDAVFGLTLTNTIIFNSEQGIWTESLSAEASIENGYINFDNVVLQFSTGISPGAGLLSVDSQFVDKSTGDYHLQAGSPCKGAGNPEDGSPDLGAFGGEEAEDSLGWQPNGK